MNDPERNQRRLERTRLVMEELAAAPEGAAWPDVWSRVLARQPLAVDETARVTSGLTRAENDVKWQLIPLDKAGWVLTGVPRLRLTVDGRRALADHPDAASLLEAATEGYQAWDAAVAAAKSESAQPTSPGQRSVRDSEVAITLAAQRLLGDGLRTGGSAFDPGRRAWSAESVASLRAAFVESPDESQRSFMEKLADQLAGQNDDVILLTAEMLALLLLPMLDWKPDTKRQRVKAVLALMDEPVHIPVDVSAALGMGVFNGGQGFKSQIWRWLATTIEVATVWWEAPLSDRDCAWEDPWAWRALVDRAPDSIPSARAEWCYLKFPQFFQPIVSAPHKQKIATAFAGEIGGGSGDVDRDLLAVTLKLAPELGPGMDFYQPPLFERWNPLVVTDQAVGRAWLVRGSSVKGVDIVPTWLTGGFISLAASRLATMPADTDDAALRQAVDTGYDTIGYSQRQAKFEEIRAFLRRMKPGDLLLTTSKDRAYVGEVTGEAQQVESTDGRSNLRRAASWDATEEPIDVGDLGAKLLGKIRAGADVLDLTDVYADVQALRTLADGDDGDDGLVVTPLVSALPADVVDRLLVGRAWLDEFVELLAERRQVILYGPPGTGKTYLAQEVAEALAGPERVTLVQFHPAYSYEDFFEGYRPTMGDDGQVGFRLVPGPFRKVVDAARDDRNHPYVLIIDEINRGNLAKVFGELYFLLEYRDRTISLLYSSEETSQFSMPDNVFLIGTMNTADRSIALVDAAMRRRFGFLSLHPDDDHLAGVLPRWLADNDLPGDRAALLAALNSRIEDREFRIGPSYLMRKSVGTDAGLERIWRTSILPLLEEHHAGDEVDVDRRYGLHALRRVVETAEESREPSVVDAPAPSLDAPAE